MESISQDLLEIFFQIGGPSDDLWILAHDRLHDVTVLVRVVVDHAEHEGAHRDISYGHLIACEVASTFLRELVLEATQILWEVLHYELGEMLILVLVAGMHLKQEGSEILSLLAKGVQDTVDLVGDLWILVTWVKSLPISSLVRGSNIS